MRTEIDTFTAHLDRIPRESPLADLCREFVQGELIPMTDAIHVGLGEGIAVVVSPVFWVWAGIKLDALRNRKETQEVQVRIEMILKLQEGGMDIARAERMVEKMLMQIGKRNKEDPAIKSLLQIVSTVKGLKTPSETTELTERTTQIEPKT